MHCTPSASSNDESGLARIVRIVLETDHQLPASDSPALLVIEQVVPGDDFPLEFELGVKPLDGDDVEGHPADLLLGFTAPPEWWAIGLLASGRTHQLAEGSARAVPHTARAARLAHLVARTGDSAMAYRHAGSSSVEVTQATAPVTGYLADVCRRTLGLPTAPPEQGPARYWEDRWLDWTMGEAMRGGPPVNWDQAVALHPLRHELPARATPTDVRDLVAARATAGWRRVLDDAASGQGAVLADGTCCSPELAAWFDEGSLSRALLGVLPDRAAMLDALAELLSASVFAVIDAALLPST